MNRMTFLLSATVLAGGLAISGAAFADQANFGLGNASDGSTATSTTGEGNATGGSTSTSTEGQGNATGGSTANTSIGSGNTHTDNINKTITADNNNTHTDTIASGNSIGSGNSDSHNDNRTDSHNDNHTINTTTNITTNVTDSSVRTVSDQDLRATVSGVAVNATSTFDPARVRTGDIAGSTYTSFSGIQTASLNTGLASVNQAASSIAANANVTFGAP